MERAPENQGQPEERGRVLSRGDFARLSFYIESSTGIRVPESKKTMLEARLQKRLRLLGLPSFERYCAYLFSKKGIRDESVHMIDSVATNKTDFFREAEHFTCLASRILPELVSLHGSGIKETLRVWSAGCSTGEEAYTIAMVLSEFALGCPGFSFSVVATDISTRALEVARAGIYGEESAGPIPLPLRKRYLLRSNARPVVKVTPELRRRIDFRRLNLMDEHYGMQEKLHVIFCRNVIIYFTRPTQVMLLDRMCRRLMTGGYIFTGHSETLHGMALPVVPVGSAVYRKGEECA